MSSPKFQYLGPVYLDSVTRDSPPVSGGEGGRGGGGGAIIETLCYGSQVWAPQSSTRDLLLLERVQGRASKYILAPGGACFADLSYRDRLIKLDLIPVSYWFEYLDLVFFYKCRNGLFNLDILKYVTPYSKSRVTRNSFISIDYKPNLTKTSTFRDSYFNSIILPGTHCLLILRKVLLFHPLKRKFVRITSHFSIQLLILTE